MDPNIVLEEIRKVLETHLMPSNGYLSVEEIDKFINSIRDLDGWLSAGGALPKDWERTKR